MNHYKHTSRHKELVYFIFKRSIQKPIKKLIFIINDYIAESKTNFFKIAKRDTREKCNCQ